MHNAFYFRNNPARHKDRNTQLPFSTPIPTICGFSSFRVACNCIILTIATFNRRSGHWILLSGTTLSLQLPGRMKKIFRPRIPFCHIFVTILLTAHSSLGLESACKGSANLPSLVFCGSSVCGFLLWSSDLELLR